MKRRVQGFTIIETTLVLAITGLIATIVLIGISTSLNQQRYIDSVNQVVNYFQGQYTATANTANDRDPKERCNPSTGLSIDTTDETVGSSNCLILGTVLRSSNGKDVTTYSVVALQDPGDAANVAGLEDSELLAASNVRQGQETDSYNVDWGSQLLDPSAAAPARFTVMVVRTPVTGTIHTYSALSDTISLTDLLTSAQSDMKLCIDQTGFFGSAVDPMGIAIKKDAANTTGVQLLSAGDCSS